MNNLLNMNFPQQPQLPFKQQYRAFPVVMANKPQLEAGDKIVLPSSALDQLARLRVTYPMMFKLTNKPLERSTHCGVMEFSAEEGVCYLPYWMMQDLLLESGSIIDVLNVTIPKGNFVKLQPHTTAFTQLNNPRVVLERALRSFSCLTTGETIAIQHGEQQFYLDVVEVKPGRAISIIETDVNVDFAPPKDMPENDARHPNSASIPAAHTTNSSLRKSSSSQLPVSELRGGEKKDGGSGVDHQEFVFHAGQDVAQEKFFEHDGGLHEGNSLLADSEGKEGGGEKKAGSTDYFAKLGGGHRLNAKKSTSSTTPTTTPTPATTAPTAVPSSLSLSSPTPATTSFKNALPPRPTTVVETVGQWDYVYNVDGKGVKKLVRRLPTKKKTADEVRDNGGGEVFKPFAGSGHSLK